MKVTRDQAAENRHRVVETAARLFRERGYHGVGVADVMKSAGLTHGGFYSQFESKEALLAEACDRAVEESIAQWDRLAARDPALALDAISSAYLSPAHRDHPGYGCVFATLGPEVARLPAEVRHGITEGVREQLARLAHLMADEGADGRRQAALVVMASMVGALVMARAVDDPTLSEDFLSAVHDAIVAPD